MLQLTTDKPTDKQTGQKNIIPDHLIWGHQSPTVQKLWQMLQLTTDKPTDKQTGQKNIIPDHLILWGHKNEMALPLFISEICKAC